MKKTNLSKTSITLSVVAIIITLTSIFIVNLLNQQINTLTVKNDCLTNAIQVEDKKATLTILGTNAINIYNQLEDGDDKTALSDKITEASDLLDYSTTDAVNSANFDYSKYKQEYADKATEIETTTNELNDQCNELIKKYKLAESE